MAKKQSSSSNKNKVYSAEWFKNVAKSLGYSLTDIANETMPTTIETVKDNADFIKETITKIKTLKGNKGNRIRSLLSDKQYKLYENLTATKANFKSSFKSGKFYSGPQDVYGDDFDDLDFSFDDDFNDDNFEVDFGDDDSSSKTPVNVKVVSNINADNPMVSSVNTQTKTMLDIAEAESKRDMVIASENMKLSHKLYGGIGAVNENIGHLVTFATRDGASFINASLKYYGDSLTQLTDISNKLSEIQTSLTKPASESSSSSSRVKWDDVVSSNGVINLSNYTQMVKKNFRGALENNMFTSSILSMLDDPDNVKVFTSQPLQFIPNFIAKAIIPGTLKTALSAFDESFKAFVPAVLTRIGDLVNNLDDPTGLLQMVGETFGLRSKTRRAVDTSKYEKGPVPFDGITRKAIVEVIPGYLSKIVSLLSNEEAQIFDYDEGKFKKRSEIKSDHDSDVRRRALSSYSSVGEIKDKLHQSGDMTASERKRLDDVVDTFFQSMATRQFRMARPGSEDFISQIVEYGKSDIDDAKRVADAIKQLKRSQQMNIAGYESLSARQGMFDYFDGLNNSGSSAVSLYNGLYDKTYDRKISKGKVGGSLFAPADKYGKSSLDYLRDIKKLMITGVATYKVNHTTARSAASALNTFDAEKAAYKASIIREDDDDTIIKADSTEDGNTEKKKSGLAKLVSFIFGDKKSKSDTISEFFKKTYGKALGLITRADKFMYDLAFGAGDDEDDTEGKEKNAGSFAERFINGITSPFKKFFGWTKDRVFTPIKEFFFGKNGLSEKIKNSPFFDSSKEKLKKLGEYLFGVKVDGKRTGGLFANTRDQLVAGKDRVVDYFAGKENGHFRDDTVFGNLRNMGRSAKSSVKNAFSNDGSFSGVGEYFKTGFKNFGDLIFGSINHIRGQNGHVDVDHSEIINTVKERAPKSLAGGIVGLGVGAMGAAGGLGLLGSMFLSPLGGAAIGIATSFLSQSDKFKNWLFGDVDENGERTGGIISKSTQQFFKKNGKTLGSGAVIGGAAGLLGFGGFLPSFILGGPVGGAVMGMGVALAAKSESMQKFLFGEMGEDGKRTGGKLSKFLDQHGKMNKETKGKLATVGVGALGGAALAKFGLLGGLMANPLLGAAAGIGAGLLATSKTFKEKLFGVTDGEGNKTKFGLLDDLKTKFDVNFIQPLKIKFFETKFSIHNWFDESIAEPLKQAFDPIAYEAKYIGERIKDFGASIAKKFMESEPMKGLTNTVKTVTKGILGGLSTVLKSITNITSKVIASPFKLVGMIGRHLMGKQAKRSKKNIFTIAFDNMANSFKETGVYKLFVSPITKAITGLGGFLKKQIFNATKFMLKGVGNILASPFKLLGLLGKGAVNGAKNFLQNRFKNKFTPETDESALERLEGIKSGERKGFGALRDVLNLTFLPNSKLSKAARQNGLEYLPEWMQGVSDRANERQLRKDKQKEFLDKLRSKNDTNKELLRKRLAEQVGLSEEDRATIGNDAFNEIIDKYQGEKDKNFSKKYLKGSKDTPGEQAYKRDVFNMTEHQTETTDDIADAVKDIRDIITGKKKPVSGPSVTTTSEGITTSNSGEAEMNRLKHDTAGDTGAEITAANAENEKIEENKTFKSKLLALLSKGNKDREEHKLSWKSIFSKEGLITTALIGGGLWLVSTIKDWWDPNGSFMSNLFSGIGHLLAGAVKGIGSAISFAITGNKEQRTDAAGDHQINSSAAETLGMRATRGAAVAVKKGGFKALKELEKEAAKTNSPKVNRSFKFKRTPDVASTGSLKPPTTKVLDAADEVIEGTAKATESAGSKFLKMARSGLDNLIGFVKKKFPTIAKKLGPFTKTIGKLFSNLTQAVTHPAQWLVKIINKAVGKSSLAVAEMIPVAGQALDLATVAFGFINGAVAGKAANLFKVPPDAVDGKMRTIASVMGGLLNFGWFFIIELVAEAFHMLSGFDLLHETAVTIYRLWANEEEQARLDASLKRHRANYDEYTKTQQIAKGNVKRDENGNIIFDDNGNPIYEDSSKIESFDSYNDRVNKSLASHIWGGVKAFGKSLVDTVTLKRTRTFLFGSKGDKEKYENAIQGIKNLEEAAARGEIDPNSKEYKDTMKQLEKARDANKSKQGLFGGGPSVSERYTSVEDKIKQLEEAAARGEIDPNNAIYKTTMKSLLAERKSLENNPLMKIQKRKEQTNELLTKLKAGESTGIALFDKLYPKIQAAKKFKELDEKVKELQRAADAEQINMSDSEFKKTMDALVKERDKYAAIAGIDPKTGERVGSLKSKAVSLSQSVSNWYNKLIANKKAKDAFDKACAGIKQLMKGVESGSIDPTTKMFSSAMKSFEQARDANAKILGLKPADYEEYIPSKDFNTMVSNAATKKLNQLNADIASGKLDGNSDTVKNQKSHYESLTTQEGPNPSNVGGQMDALGLLSKYTMTSGYTTRVLDGKTEQHKGVDLSRPQDTPIESFTSGSVYKVVNGFEPNSGSLSSSGGFGNYVVVKDPNGNYNYYAHMNKTSVKEGDMIDVGDKLGELGSTGRSTGPHLHYEIRKRPEKGADTYNPIEYLKGNLSSIASTDAYEPTGKSSSSGLFSKIKGKLSDIFSFSESDGIFTRKLKDTMSKIREIFGLSSNDDTTSLTKADSPVVKGITSASNLRDELAGKILELSTANEGQYNTVNANDVGKYSVGIMQFRDGHAREMFRRMAAADPSLKDKTDKFISWSGSALSKDQAKEMTDFLTSNAALAQDVQTKYANEIILGSNMKVPWAMFNDGELRDPRSVVLAADIGNTGPGHLSNWRKLFVPAKNEGNSDLLYVRNSLKSSDSWWGQQKGINENYKGWMNRIDKTYDKLTNWSPKHSIDAVGGEYEPYTGNRYRLMRSIGDVAKASGGESKIVDLLSTMVKILTDIATNTHETSTNIQQLPEKIQPTEIKPVVANASVNPIYEAVEKNRSRKFTDKYTVAKKIAAGGI